jgi:hypothetical protein
VSLGRACLGVGRTPLGFRAHALEHELVLMMREESLREALARKTRVEDVDGLKFILLY